VGFIVEQAARNRQGISEARVQLDFDALRHQFRYVEREEVEAREGVRLIVVNLLVEEVRIQIGRAAKDRRLETQFVGVRELRLELKRVCGERVARDANIGNVPVAAGSELAFVRGQIRRAEEA